MADLTKLNTINQVIETYFEKNTSLTIVPAKKLMPDFISAGIFAKDHKNGLPIRKILRELDSTNELQLIPFVYAERNEQNTYWYFIPSNAEIPTTPYKQEEKKPGSKENLTSRLNSDETYVIDLCDEALGLVANRQKRFNFLLGDLHKDGISQTKLPVDAFYESLQLVIEYREIQNIESVEDIDNPNKETSSGVSRNEQRKIYDKRREEVLPENDISLVIISGSDFSCDTQNKIIRNKEADIKIVQNALKETIKSE